MDSVSFLKDDVVNKWGLEATLALLVTDLHNPLAALLASIQHNVVVMTIGDLSFHLYAKVDVEMI